MVLEPPIRLLNALQAESQMNSKKRIFVSHSSTDAEVARIIVDALRGYSFEVWYDEQNLEFGHLRQLLEESLRACQVFMVLLSPDALKSIWVNREINAALALEGDETGMLIVPVLVRPCSIPPILRGYRFLNFVSAHDPVIELGKFVEIVAENRSSQPHPPTSNDKYTSAQATQTPSHQPPVSNSIGSISGKTVNVNMGEKILITNTNNCGLQTSPPTRIDNTTYTDDLYLSRFMALVDELNEISDTDVSVDLDRLKLFMEIMEAMTAREISFSPSLIEKVRVLCKQLGVMSLI